jgi:YVTN family beta-propeller protein
MAIAVAASGYAAALAAPLAYVSNEGSASVSVIDTASDKIAATFKVGTKPRGIALSTDGKRLYISDQSSNSLLAIDAVTGAVVSLTISPPMASGFRQRSKKTTRCC